MIVTDAKYLGPIFIYALKVERPLSGIGFGTGLVYRFSARIPNGLLTKIRHTTM